MPQEERLAAYNLDGTEKVTIRRIAESVLRLTGSERPIEFVPARSGDYGGVDVSSEKAKRDLGWEPRVGFEEGLEHSIAWLMTQEKRPEAVSG